MTKDKKKGIGSTFRKIRLTIYLIVVIALAALFSPLFSGYPGIFSPSESQAPVATRKSQEPTPKPKYFKIVVKEDKFFVDEKQVDANTAAKMALDAKLPIEIEYTASARTIAEEAINSALKALNLSVDRVTKPVPPSPTPIKSPEMTTPL